jgi:amidohydrolase
MEDLSALKDRVCREVDAMQRDLIALSKRIYEHPELGFQERQAVEWLGAFLRDGGFAFEPGIAGLETAFRAQSRGSSEHPHVALLAEYDALPGLGHACGHNLICTASVGAAVALRRAAHTLPGTLTVLGTPAEEGGGGKVFMVERGVFDGVDAAMMFHPSRNNLWTRGALAALRLTVRFHGRAAHAAAMPEKGINALNALLLTFHGIDSLRQHVTSDVRIHGIVSHGGDAPNIVPAFAEGKFSVRAGTRRALTGVLAMVKWCAEAGAAASGARVEFDEGPVYAERYNNRVLADFFAENMRRFGVEGEDPPTQGGVGSSDIGNVSMAVPTIHPYLKIVEGEVSGHTPEFREASGSAMGFDAMLLAAKGLALTALDVMYRPGGSDEAWAAFRASVRATR